MIRAKLFLFRWWLASKIVGFDLNEEIESAYEAGRQYGQAQKFLEQK